MEYRALFCCQRGRGNGRVLDRSPGEPSMLFVEVGRMATVGGRPFISIGVTVGTLALPLLPLAMGSTVIA